MSTSKIEDVAPDAVGVDMRVQRALDERRVVAILAAFDADVLGVLTASRRPDGTMVYLDGQTRAEVLRRRGEGGTAVPTVVYTGLTLEEEAAMFLRLNDAKRVDSVDTFRIAVTQKDPIALRANKAIELYGWTAEPGQKNSFRAVTTLYSLIEANEWATKQALMVLSGVWGASKHSAAAGLLAGFTAFIARYGHQFDMDYSSLIQKISEEPQDTPQKFVGRCRANKETRGIPLPDAVADVLVGIYNKRRRELKVPTWTT